MKFFLVFLFLMQLATIKAQISSPGLGDANSASWFAIGVKQEMNEEKTSESMTYLGVGFKSDLDNYNLVDKPSIFIINQEFSHKINSNWKIAYAVSHRNQQEFTVNELDNKEGKSIQQEFRVYGKLSYLTNIGKLKLTQSFREDLRKFMDEDWKNTEEPFQLRSRFKTQANLSLDKNKQHGLTVAAEVLFSTSKNNSTKKWSNFEYKEARFSAFYSYQPSKIPFTISLGYMNNLIGKNTTYSVHYASLDILWKNPFKFLKRK